MVPIHCRGSTGDQVMVSQICSDEETNSSILRGPEGEYILSKFSFFGEQFLYCCNQNISVIKKKINSVFSVSYFNAFMPNK